MHCSYFGLWHILCKFNKQYHTDNQVILLTLCLISGIKDYSNWPTVPQIYINGEFVGGCDIMIELHQKGDLVEELKKAGITSALSGSSK